MALITLTSDIGSPDYLVGAIKAQLLRLNPEASLIDISHNIPPFNYPQAAYVCRSAFKHFPAQTFHLILVDLFAKKPDRLILAFHQDQYFLCADNGLLSMILEDSPSIVMGIPIDPASARTTLAITEVIGEVVQRIDNGEPILQIGTPDVSFQEKRHLRPIIEQQFIEGQIIFIDSFENVIVNITREQFEENRKGRGFKIVFRGDEMIEQLSESYADVGEGEKLALFNSAGYLEIAINKGNAAGLFGLKGYTDKSRQGQLAYQTVRVYFQ
jgi:S-adenosyl-L-methionine hydrolase (adenosine-forming)